MNNTDYIKSDIRKVIVRTIRYHAKKIVALIESDYAQLPNSLGKATAGYELEDEITDLIVLSLFGEGQKALIGEYGRGSKLDKDNPALKEYINGDIFNKERLKHNFAILTRPKDDSYKDLDGNVIVRKKPKYQVNLEQKNPKYAAIEPRYIVEKAIEQKLDSIVDDIQIQVATAIRIDKLINGLKFEIKL